MRLPILASALTALIAVATATAEERPAEVKRGAYVVQYAAANDLAGMLTKQFKGTAEIQAGPEGTSNCILVNASPAVFDEVMKTLEKLDRRPHAVTVEVFVVELPLKRDEDKRLDEKEVTGALDDLAKRLEGLVKKRQVTGFKRFELSALEGQAASVRLIENKPFSLGGGSRNYRDVGTIIKVTPQVVADGSITLDLNLQDNSDRDAGDGTGLPEFVLSSFVGKISVGPGKASLAKDVKFGAKEGEGRTLVIVGARVNEAEKKGK